MVPLKLSWCAACLPYEEEETLSAPPAAVVGGSSSRGARFQAASALVNTSRRGRWRGRWWGRRKGAGVDRGPTTTTTEIVGASGGVVGGLAGRWAQRQYAAQEGEGNDATRRRWEGSAGGAHTTELQRLPCCLCGITF